MNTPAYLRFETKDGRPLDGEPIRGALVTRGEAIVFEAADGRTGSFTLPEGIDAAVVVARLYADEACTESLGEEFGWTMGVGQTAEVAT